MIKAEHKSKEVTELMIEGKGEDLAYEFSAVVEGFHRALTHSGFSDEKANRFILALMADAVKKEKENG